MAERAVDAQLEALRAFTFLTSLRTEWSGALIVACGLGASGEALSVAANIAGGGFLGIDARAEACRAAMRAGACDFVVNTVDEALRVLKNEIRKRKPVSVALQMDEAKALDEVTRRGVLPEMFTAFVQMQAAWEAAEQFGSLGATVVRFGGLPGDGVDAEALLEEFATARGWALKSLTFADTMELRAGDEALLKVVAEDDPRRRWFASASRFFHRERPHRRVGYLTQTERDRLG